MRITGKGSGYPFSVSEGNVSEITLKLVPLRQTVLEKPAYPGFPCKSHPPTSTSALSASPQGSMTSRIWSVLHHSVTSQVTPSRRQQTTEMPTRRLQKYWVFLAVSKHLRSELLGHGTLSIYSRKGQPCCKPSCPPLGMKHPWLKVWQQAPGADQRHGCCQVPGMFLLPHSLTLLESLILKSF